jgi:hypothetical protein
LGQVFLFVALRVAVRSGAGKRKVEMAISYFRILRSVVHDAIRSYCDCRSITRDEAFGAVGDYLVRNSSEYYKDSPALNYEDPLCRIAYLYAYVAAHANLLDNALCQYEQLLNYMRGVATSSGGAFRVCSLGGGPGSELLGLAKFIERERTEDSFARLEFVLIDRVQEWAETWDALAHGLEEHFRASHGDDARLWPLMVSKSFLPLDLTKTGDFGNFAMMFTQELFISNYLVSEIRSSLQEFREMFRVIVEGAPFGAWFLFIDWEASDRRLEEYVESLINENGLDFHGIMHQATNMDGDEQAEDLGELFDLLGGRHPQLTWRAFFALARKPEIPF